MNALASSGVKVVFIPIYAEEASTFLTQAKGKFADDVYFFGADGLDGILGKVSQDVTIADNVLMMTPFAADSADPKVQAFVKAYQDAYNATPDQFAADAYDAVYAVKAAVEAANGSTSGADLAAVMPTITVEGVTGMFIPPVARFFALVIPSGEMLAATGIALVVSAIVFVLCLWCVPKIVAIFSRFKKTRQC